MRANPCWILLGAVILTACPGRAVARDIVAPLITAREGVLNLRTGDVDTALLPNRLNDQAFGQGVHVLMLDGPMNPQRRAGLEASGVAILGYLPLNAFLADVAGTTPAALRALGFVRWAGAYQESWKIEPELAAGVRAPVTPERQALAAAGEVAVSVWAFAGRPAQVVVDALRAVPGARVKGVEMVGGGACVNAMMPRANVQMLSGLADVQFVEELAEYTLRSNATTRWVVQSNVPLATPLYDRGLTGTGQIVGIIDGRVGAGHCSFVDTNPIGPLHRKIEAYNATNGYNFHGTHVAGTAVGDGGDSGDTRGVAYNARMVFNTHPSADEASMYGRFALHTSQGARVHSNSWGADWTREYEGGCRGIDAASRDFDDILILHSVSDGAIVTNPENAKNSLAVAASAQAPAQENWCFGGIGPTLDGRRKPEILASGCGIFSSSGPSGCGTAGASGTSMACPAAAGLATLMRQYFTEGFYPHGQALPGYEMVPSGQLLKAMMVNSARDMVGVGGFPSDREGWGRVVGDDALYFTGDSRRLIVHDVRNDSPAALTTDAWFRTRVVTQVGEPLKITAAWADVPAEINATFVPINNLDLVVVSPSGIEYRGNFFGGGQSAPGGGGGAADALNNLEQVLVLNPEAGTWTVDVVGTAVNMDVQGFALVVTGLVTPYTCDGDVNQDGNLDGFDVQCMEIAIGGGPCEVTVLDFNGDGNLDGFDVQAVERVVGGGECP